MIPSRDIAYARLCEDTYHLAELGDEFAFNVGTVDGLYTICFRGTKSWKEWILDLFAFPLFPLATQYRDAVGPVHAGFLFGAETLLPLVQRRVAGQPYALCGHSLGGALASIVAGFLTQQGHPPTEVVTFGSPRPAMPPLALYLRNIPIRQYRLGEDIVPCLPSNPPFAHVAPIIQFGSTVAPWSSHDIRQYISQMEKAHAPEVARHQPAVAG